MPPTIGEEKECYYFCFYMLDTCLGCFCDKDQRGKNGPNNHSATSRCCSTKRSDRRMRA